MNIGHICYETILGPTNKLWQANKSNDTRLQLARSDEIVMSISIKITNIY